MDRILELFRYSKEYDSKYSTLVHNNVVSEGHNINNELTKFFDNNNIEIKHSKEVYSVGDSSILITKGEHFKSASNFHHAILHETAHCLTWDMIDRSSRNSIELKYLSVNGTFPDINQLLSVAGRDPERINDLDNLSKAVCCAYLKEEVSVELAAYNMLGKLGFQPDNTDTAYAKWNISNSMKILESAGVDLEKFKIAENAHTLLSHFEKSIDMQRHFELKNEIQNEKNNDKGIERE